MCAQLALRDVRGLLNDLMVALSGADGAVWFEALKKFMRKENPWLEVTKATVVLLKKVTTVVVPTVAEFSTVVFLDDDSPVGWIGDNFKRMFGNHTESETSQSALQVHQLTESARDPAIIAELGGEQIAETTLGQMWQMLLVQGQGQDGNLLINGFANIFYIRSQVDNQLWAVYCRWDSGNRDWLVNAYPVSDPDDWYAGSQVFSPRFSS